MPSAEQLAEAFAVEVSVGSGTRRLACLGVEEGPLGPSLTLELTVREGGEVISMMEQPVALAGLGTSDPRVLAQRAAERMRDPRFELATPFLLVVRPFEPVSGSFDGAPRDALRAVCDALSAQAHDTDFEARFDRLFVWPEAPRTVYFLGLASALLGGNGLESFLGRAPFDEIVGVRDALISADCPRLLARLRQGLTLAGSEGAEFMMQTDEAWLEAEGLAIPAGAERPWARIDGHEEGRTYWLVEHELEPKRLAYFAAHRDELVAG